MYQRTALIMAFVFLFSSTELHELARLPRLFIHYIHHRQEDPSLSLAGFMRLHYRQDHPADNDERDDQQLPFKAGYDGLLKDITNSIFPPPVTGHIFFPEAAVYCYFPEGAPLHRAYTIFHPPRMVSVIANS